MLAGYQNGNNIPILGNRAQGRPFFDGKPIEWLPWFPTLHSDGSITVMSQTNSGHANVFRIVTIVRCGYILYSSRGHALRSEIKIPESKYIYTGGRTSEIATSKYDEEFEFLSLTKPQTQSVEQCLQELNLNAKDYILSNTVHGKWKVRKNQGIVAVAKGEEECS